MAAISHTFHLVTDGSADAQSESAGAAFILTSPDREIRIKVNTFLGAASSVEAEMIAGFLGITMACRVSDLGFASVPMPLLWQLDHQPTILGFNKQLSIWRERGWGSLTRSGPKNLALWQLLDRSTAELSITAEHVGDGGDISSHTACDRSSRWARTSADRLLSVDGGAAVGRLSEYQPENAWRFLDGRGLMEAARDCARVSEALSLARLLSEQIVVERREIGRSGS
jgi:ribonuclease HI